MKEKFRDHASAIAVKEMIDPTLKVRAILRELMDEKVIDAKEFAKAVSGLNEWMANIPDEYDPHLFASLYYELLLQDEFVPPVYSLIFIHCVIGEVDDEQ
jgi:hypothetical protein